MTRVLSWLCNGIAVTRHAGFRVYLTFKQLPLYLYSPRLLLIELVLVFQEALSFLLFPVNYFRRRPKQPLYGTLPFSTLCQFMPYLSLSSQSIVCDLGSGKGKCLLFFSIMTRCHSIGIEISKNYHRIHWLLATLCFLNKNHTLVNQSICHAPLPKASVYFISGLGMPNTLIANIQDQLNTLRSPIIVLSVGIKFTFKHLTLHHTFSSETSWGYCPVFIYQT